MPISSTICPLFGCQWRILGDPLAAATHQGQVRSDKRRLFVYQPSFFGDFLQTSHFSEKVFLRGESILRCGGVELRVDLAVGNKAPA